MNINEAVLVQVVVGYWDTFSFGTLAPPSSFSQWLQIESEG